MAILVRGCGCTDLVRLWFIQQAFGGHKAHPHDNGNKDDAELTTERLFCTVEITLPRRNRPNPNFAFLSISYYQILLLSVARGETRARLPRRPPVPVGVVKTHVAARAYLMSSVNRYPILLGGL